MPAANGKSGEEVKVQLFWETKSNRNNMPKQNRMFCYQSLGCHHDKPEGNLFYDKNLMIGLPDRCYSSRMMWVDLAKSCPSHISGQNQNKKLHEKCKTMRIAL